MKQYIDPIIERLDTQEHWVSSYAEQNKKAVNVFDESWLVPVAMLIIVGIVYIIGRLTIF